MNRDEFYDNLALAHANNRRKDKRRSGSSTSDTFRVGPEDGYKYFTDGVHTYKRDNSLPEFSTGDTQRFANKDDKHRDRRYHELVDHRLSVGAVGSANRHDGYKSDHDITGGGAGHGHRRNINRSTSGKERSGDNYSDNIHDETAKYTIGTGTNAKNIQSPRQKRLEYAKKRYKLFS